MAAEPCDIIPIPEFTPDYTPKGEYELLDSRKVYVVGNPKASYAVICIYDIFGLHKNTFQGADYLATGTTDAPLVVMPDFFNGKPVDPDGGPEARTEWMNKNNAVNHIPFVETVLKWIKRQYPSIKTIGLYGFCWGGKVALMCAKMQTVGAVALIHPSRLVESDSKGIENFPVLIIASKDESVESMDAVVKNLQNVEYLRYDDVHHGWCAARGDWGVPLQKQRAEEAMMKTNEFFHKFLL
ncbi:Alpha/Beta hydrolase protein [Lipomyces arxii]|uniref:Alpha/Beta hydrolase protein n=1 Tax=Lipomyces arxii TaxID=56418 RepID=UPI0034CDF2C3